MGWRQRSRCSFCLRCLAMMNADRATAAARLVNDRESRCPMLVQLSTHFVKGIISSTTCRCGTHDPFDGRFRCPVVISNYFVAHVTLGDDADDRSAVLVLYYRGATATGFTHCEGRLLNSLTGCAARLRIQSLHFVTTATHCSFSLPL